MYQNVIRNQKHVFQIGAATPLWVEAYSFFPFKPDVEGGEWSLFSLDLSTHSRCGSAQHPNISKQQRKYYKPTGMNQPDLFSPTCIEKEGTVKVQKGHYCSCQVASKGMNTRAYTNIDGVKPANSSFSKLLTHSESNGNGKPWRIHPQNDIYSPP